MYPSCSKFLNQWNLISTCFVQAFVDWLWSMSIAPILSMYTDIGNSTVKPRKARHIWTNLRSLTPSDILTYSASVLLSVTPVIPFEHHPIKALFKKIKRPIMLFLVSMFPPNSASNKYAIEVYAGLMLVEEAGLYFRLKLCM